MVVNIAHRGARSLAPENTLAAAREAREVGADLWETDVSVTADGELILLHDDSLARTTDARTRFPGRAPWRVASFTLAEVRTLDAGAWFVESDPFGQIAAGAVAPAIQDSYRGESVPTVHEALAFTRDDNWCINLELKRLPSELKGFPIVERVLDAVHQLAMPPQQVILSSFHHEWLRQAQQLRSDIAVQALIGYRPVGPLDWGDLSFATYNARSTRITEAKIREVTARDIAVNLFTVNEVADMRRFIAAGITGLFTDFPQRLAELEHRP
jgi:glycerophosphoryl diester phosphodiesterase